MDPAADLLSECALWILPGFVTSPRTCPHAYLINQHPFPTAVLSDQGCNQWHPRETGPLCHAVTSVLQAGHEGGHGDVGLTWELTLLTPRCYSMVKNQPQVSMEHLKK